MKSPAKLPVQLAGATELRCLRLRGAVASGIHSAQAVPAGRAGQGVSSPTLGWSTAPPAGDLGGRTVGDGGGVRSPAALASTALLAKSLNFKQPLTNEVWNGYCSVGQRPCRLPLAGTYTGLRGLCIVCSASVSAT